jgi:diaminopimelate decarboxylase
MAKPDESHTEKEQERNPLLSIDTEVRVSVDSTYELHALSELAEGSGRGVDIAFRVNPDVSPDAHPKIAPGLATPKFGDQV